MPTAATENAPAAPEASATVAAPAPAAAAARWMTLGEVSRALEINEATLRQWADRGRLPVYRTPGGHRRFLRADVEALMRAADAGQTPPAASRAVRETAVPETAVRETAVPETAVRETTVPEATVRETAVPETTTPEIDDPEDLDPEDLALRRIRSQLTRSDLSQQAWLQSFRAEGRDRMRLFGRRLLSLLLQNHRHGPSRRMDETLSETHMLGHESGSEMADRSVPLTDSVRAFLFFRQAVVETVPPEQLRQVVEMSDRVLVGLVSAYDSRRNAAANDHNHIADTAADADAASHTDTGDQQ